MAYHRIKLTDPAPNNHSFSHHLSTNQHQQSKHKKKGSLFLKNQRTPNCTRLRTDEKDPLLLNPDPVKSHAASIILTRSNHSVTKLSKGKRVCQPSKKSKHTISVINISKNAEERQKGSSTVTKRKQSQVNFSEKIREKIQDFRVISNCLEEYSKEERRNNSEGNLIEILKIIAAFNRSEIGPISKPLERLIHEIVHSIEHSLPQPRNQGNIKKSISFSSPQKQNENISKSVKNTVKKAQGSRDCLFKKEDSPAEVSTLEENLGRLKYQSNRLKYFLEEIASNSQQEKKLEDPSSRGKIEELQNLRSIAQEQAKIIRQLQNSEQDDTFRQETS